MSYGGTYDGITHYTPAQAEALHREAYSGGRDAFDLAGFLSDPCREHERAELWSQFIDEYADLIDSAIRMVVLNGCEFTDAMRKRIEAAWFGYLEQAHKEGVI